MHGDRCYRVAAEELGREVCVSDGDTERDGPTAALVAPDVERVLGTFLRLDGLVSAARRIRAWPTSRLTEWSSATNTGSSCE